MITVSDDALAYIEQWRSDASDDRCLIGVYWQKGTAENRRGADGQSIWERLPDPGWDVQLLRHVPDAPWESAQELAPGIRVLVGATLEHPFASGHIYLDGRKLKIKANAV